MRIKKLLLVLVALVLCLSIATPITTAFAGVNRLDVASLSSKDTGWELENASTINWTDETASFTATTDENATVTTSEYFLDEMTENVNYYSVVTAKLKITSFETDAYFAFSLGAENYSDTIGTAGTLEVYLKAGSTNKITVGTRIVGDASSEKETPDVVTLGEEFEIKYYITADKKLNVFIGAEDETPELTKEYDNPFVGGLFSFGQKGKTTTEVLSLLVNRYDYETPSTPNYLETFDATDPNHTDGKAGYNAKMFASYGKFGTPMPTFMEVKTNEQSGNSYLRFQNVSYGHIMTRYAYSNFELTFDLFDMPTKLVKDGNGNVVSYCAPTFNVYIGCQNIATESASINPYLTTKYGKVVGGSSSTNLETEIALRQVVTTVDGVDYYRDGEGREKSSASCTDLAYQTLDGTATKTPPNLLRVTDSGVCDPMKVKISLIDGIYKLYVINASDYENESSWDNIGATLKLDLGLTPKGYVAIGFEGSQVEPVNGNLYSMTSGTASIDNLSIKNKDVNGSIVTNVGYQNNAFITRDDITYNYDDFYNDDALLVNKLTNGGGLGTVGVIILIASIALVLGAGAVVTVILLKRRAK